MSRTAFVVSVAVHLAAGYALSRHSWTIGVPPPAQSAEFIWLADRLLPPPREAPAPVETLPESRLEPPPELRTETRPEPLEVPPAPESREAPSPAAVEPALEPVVVTVPPTAVEQPASPAVQGVESFIDFEEARRRAAAEVVEERAAESPYLTFSLADVVEPRPIEEPERPSIFDGGGGPRGPSVGQMGQARTRVGHRLTELCNALTGGFSLMGFGSFCARADDEPSGLFPEVRPAYLDLMPECVETRPLAPLLDEESPFPTIKCRLVRPEPEPTIPR
jgi:hypothetical protein